MSDTGRRVARPEVGTSGAGRNRLPTRPVVIALILVISTVSWRRSVYFAGGLDPVVVAKAVLSLVGLGLAVDAAIRTKARHRVAAPALGLLVAYLVIGLFGAASTPGTWYPSVILTIRVIITAAAVVALLYAYATTTVFAALVTACGTVAAVAAVTGVSSLASGRLSGGIPPLTANELAELCGIVTVYTAWRALHGGGLRRAGWMIVVLLAVSWLTGSRTGLIALLIALAVLFLPLRRWPTGVVMAGVAAVPVIFYFVAATDVVGRFATRGGSANVATLNARTVAWSAAFHLHHGFWNTWFGSGLSTVRIPVIAQYREDQILDSSWISALVQGGKLGIGLLAVWVVYGAVAAARSRPGYRVLATALFAFVVARSFLETGLLDSSPEFMIFLLLCIAGDRQEAPAAVRALPPPRVLTAEYPQRRDPVLAASAKGSDLGC